MAVEATGTAISEASEGLGTKVNDWRDEREQKVEERKRREEEIRSGLYVEGGKTVVCTIDGMCRWLDGVSYGVTGAYAEVVNSPVTMRVHVDRFVNLLNRALEASTDGGQKSEVKDAFASMFQNLFSFIELKINYLTERRDDEANELARLVRHLFGCYQPVDSLPWLLSKYRKVLVEIRKAELIAPIRKKYSSMATEKAIKTIGKAFMPDSIKDLTHPAGYALKTAFHAASGIGNVISEFQENRANLAAAERTRLQHPGGKCCEERD